MAVRLFGASDGIRCKAPAEHARKAEISGPETKFSRARDLWKLEICYYLLDWMKLCRCVERKNAHARVRHVVLI